MVETLGERRYLSQLELSDRWRCSSNTITNIRRREPSLRCLRLPGSNRWIYCLASIEELEQKKMEVPVFEKPSTTKEWRVK